MASSLGLWSPGVPALAVYVGKDDQELDWDQYCNRLAKRLRDLAEQEEDPEHVLGLEWSDQVGGWPSLTPRGVESMVDAAEFQDLLLERHGIRQSDFPMKVKRDRDLEAEGLPSNLAEWVRDVR
jgi:hypothetical protein